MARKLSDEEHEQLAEHLRQHNAQVLACVVPEDSPPDFIRPEGEDTCESRGLPYWFGPPNPDVETLVVGPNDSIGKGAGRRLQGT